MLANTFNVDSKNVEQKEDEILSSNAPKVGTKAKDYAGEEVDIIDVLKLPAKQRDLDWFLNQYDDSGIMRDCYRDPEGYDFDPDEYDYYVAVEHPNLGETAVYVWGPDGVCYSGEDLKEGCHKVNELKREPKQATKSDLKGFASKEATLNRAKRAEKGNWKNSIGEFVEKHSAEIGEVSPLGKAALVNYIETKMKPELSDEAKAKVDELVNSSRSITDLMFALYNTMLKGAGMGLHEGEEDQDMDDAYYNKLVKAYNDLSEMPEDEDPGLYFSTAYKVLKRDNYITGDVEEDIDRISDYCNDGYGYDSGYPENWRDLDADDIDPYKDDED